VAPSSARRRGTFSAFRRPFLTDPVFWIAAGMSIAIGVLVSSVLVALGGRFPDSLLSWGVAILFFVIAGWLSFKLLAMGLNTSRALEESQPSDERRAASLENKGRSAGAVAGKGAAALMKRGKKSAAPSTDVRSGSPAPEPSPTSPATEATSAAATPAADGSGTDVTVDKAARVLGSMVGRRLADRRKDES
jgi:cytoskeletal protein RodZ